MALKKIGEFFDKKKADIHFSSAGRGQTLGNEPTPKAQLPPKPARAESDTDRPVRTPAGEAALARINAKATKGPVKPRVFAAASAADDGDPSAQLRASTCPPALPSADPAPAPLAPMNLRLRFICPFTSVSVPAAEIQAHLVSHVSAHLRPQLEDVGLCASLIRTAASSPEACAACIDTLSRIVANIISNPAEPKFRRIKLSNKVLQARVQPVPGGIAFLRCLGFAEATEENEPVLLLPEDSLPAFLESVPGALEALESAQPLAGRLDRDLQLFAPDTARPADLARFALPDDFFTVTADDVRAQAEAHKAEVDLAQTLRTQAMREAEKDKRRRYYRYAVMRFRLPDGRVLQGVFGVREHVQALREFVSDALADPALEFHLRVPGLPELDDNSTLLEAQLAPLALIAVSFPTVAQSEYATLLRPEISAAIQPLTY